MRRISLYYSLIGTIIVTGLMLFLIKQESKVPYALEVDATKDTTDIAGTYYRVRINNVGMNALSNISIYLDKNDVQYLEILPPGQSFFFYPKPDTEIEKIRITTKEGVSVLTDYRTQLKGIGLPGSGR